MLTLWEFHAVYFKHIHTLPLIAIINIFSSFPTQLWALFLSFTSSLSPLCVVQLLLEVGPSLECDWSTRGHLIKETWLSISLWLPNANGTSGCDGISFPPCPTYAGLWHDWNLPRFSAYCLKCCEFICASSLLDPESTLPLMLSTTSV